MLWTHLLGLPSLCLTGLGMLCFHLVLFYLFPSWFLSWSTFHSVVRCSVSMSLYPPCYFCYLYPAFINGSHVGCSVFFAFSYISWDLLCVLLFRLLRKYSLCLGHVFCRCVLGPFVLWGYLTLVFLCLFFCLDDLSIRKSEGLERWLRGLEHWLVLYVNKYSPQPHCWMLSLFQHTFWGLCY